LHFAESQQPESQQSTEQKDDVVEQLVVLGFSRDKAVAAAKKTVCIPVLLELTPFNFIVPFIFTFCFAE
jgi:hypothetical protein